MTAIRLGSVLRDCELDEFHQMGLEPTARVSGARREIPSAANVTLTLLLKEKWASALANMHILNKRCITTMAA